MASRRVGSGETRGDLAEIIERVAHGGERVVIRRHDRELAAVIPMEYLRLLERLIEEVEDRIDAEEARKVSVDPALRELVPVEILERLEP